MKRFLVLIMMGITLLGAGCGNPVEDALESKLEVPIINKIETEEILVEEIEMEEILIEEIEMR